MHNSGLRLDGHRTAVVAVPVFQMDIGDPMSANSFREEVAAALERSASYDDLRAIVLRHKARGVGQQATYAALESIRIELGCNRDQAEKNPLCERVEDLMDRVWGYCPQAECIWESSLSEARGE